MPQPKDPLAEIPPLLLTWYDNNARILPWRDNPTPYRVWVSEIMLQQTRVEAVKPYFERFVSALPDVKALAEAPEEKLLKLWEGLGYYSRVKNMQKAAVILMERYGGELPSSREELSKLPGIGDYTSGSIASIAFNIPVPAVDGNVLRVISRVTASREDIVKPQVKKSVEAAVAKIVPERAGDFNQALMELGALVCLPNTAPLCSSCPLAGICRAYEQGIQEELPVRQKKAARRVEQKTVFLLVMDQKAALRKRPDKGLLGGMWEFPSAPGHLTLSQARSFLEDKGFCIQTLSALKPAKHIFSHVEWRMQGIYALVSSCGEGENLVWRSAEELKREVALPSAFEPFANLFYSLCG